MNTTRPTQHGWMLIWVNKKNLVHLNFFHEDFAVIVFNLETF